jgi:mRNA interferase MazF
LWDWVTRNRGLVIADIVIASFPDHQPPGHEQQGFRPAIVIGLPAQVQSPRYPVLLVVPITSDRGEFWVEKAPKLYPRLKAGAGNLPKDSIALLDQVRSLASAWAQPACSGGALSPYLQQLFLPGHAPGRSLPSTHLPWLADQT